MDKETQADRLAKVESILKDAYRSAKDYKEQRDTPIRGLTPQTRSTHDTLTGKIRGIHEVLDVFAEAGFEVRDD